MFLFVASVCCYPGLVVAHLLRVDPSSLMSVSVPPWRYVLVVFLVGCHSSWPGCQIGLIPPFQTSASLCLVTLCLRMMLWSVGVLSRPPSSGMGHPDIDVRPRCTSNTLAAALRKILGPYFRP